ncbi:MAG: hypothetical protein ACPL25_08000 [Ignavibacteria bacterium]
MSLSQKLKSILFISLIFYSLTFAQIAFFKFTDKSSYKGTWNLSQEVSDFISDYFRAKYNLNILSSRTTENLINENQELSSTDILLSKNIEFTINGIIHTFSINRLMAGEPKVAQYETYSNEIEIEFIITELKTNKILFDEKIEQKSTDLGVGVTIFGRETDTKKEFNQLDQIKFGSDEFLKTLVGRNLIKLCEKFSTRVEPLLNLSEYKEISKSDTSVYKSKFKRKIISGEILFVDEETKEVFINLGKRENLEVGSILPVYAPRDTLIDDKTGEVLGVTDKKIGEIEIIEVRGDRFSLGIIKDQKEKIRKGYKVRRIELLPE